MAEVIIPYKPRPLQAAIHDSLRRFNVLVCHRRFGKTVLAINELVKQAAACPRQAPRYGYIAPLYKQAKSVAWDYLKFYTDPFPGRTTHESELRVDLPWGARIQLFGADNPDALRGMYLDGGVLDEPAQMAPRTWREVIRPALSDREGWALFVGTPAGHNFFYDMYRHAEEQAQWYAGLYRASETGILSPEELEDARATMGEDEYQQEYECSFTAAIRGSYYGKILEKHRDHVRSVPWEPQFPVNTFWDLGVADSTAIWFHQYISGEHRIIDFYEASGEGLQHYAGILNGKPYTYGTHYAPHDIEVRELGSGMSRKETARNFGIEFKVVPNQPVQDGIQAVRTVLPACYFDAVKCKDGLEALRQYQREWDDKRQTFRMNPRHDWTSHAADAFRYFAVGFKAKTTGLTAKDMADAARAA